MDSNTLPAEMSSDPIWDLFFDPEPSPQPDPTEPQVGLEPEPERAEVPAPQAGSNNTELQAGPQPEPEYAGEMSALQVEAETVEQVEAEPEPEPEPRYAGKTPPAWTPDHFDDAFQGLGPIVDFNQNNFDLNNFNFSNNVDFSDVNNFSTNVDFSDVDNFRTNVDFSDVDNFNSESVVASNGLDAFPDPDLDNFFSSYMATAATAAAKVTISPSQVHDPVHVNGAAATQKTVSPRPVYGYARSNGAAAVQETISPRPVYGSARSNGATATQQKGSPCPVYGFDRSNGATVAQETQMPKPKPAQRAGSSTTDPIVIDDVVQQYQDMSQTSSSPSPVYNNGNGPAMAASAQMLAQQQYEAALQAAKQQYEAALQSAQQQYQVSQSTPSTQNTAGGSSMLSQPYTPTPQKRSAQGQVQRTPPAVSAAQNAARPTYAPAQAYNPTTPPRHSLQQTTSASSSQSSQSVNTSSYGEGFPTPEMTPSGRNRTISKVTSTPKGGKNTPKASKSTPRKRGRNPQEVSEDSPSKRARTQSSTPTGIPAHETGPVAQLFGKNSPISERVAMQQAILAVDPNGRRPVETLMKMRFNTLNLQEKSRLLLPLLQGVHPLEAERQELSSASYGATRQREALEKAARLTQEAEDQLAREQQQEQQQRFVGQQQQFGEQQQMPQYQNWVGQ